MLITPKKFVRKPFSVEAVQVTEENMPDVAAWCSGEQRTSTGKNGVGEQKYIKVNVKRPLGDRQTMAYVGDWVVTVLGEAVRGFKVYSPRAFSQTFEEVVEDMIETIERMEDRAKQEEQMEQDGLFPEELHFSHQPQ